MSYQDFIYPELTILIPVLYVAGMMLKATPKVKDWIIPYILTALSFALCLIWVISTKGFNLMSLFMSFTQSVLCTACSVYGNQIIKQFKRKDENDNENDSKDKDQ